jgi:hypothetical protein
MSWRHHAQLLVVGIWRCLVRVRAHGGTGGGGVGGWAFVGLSIYLDDQVRALHRHHNDSQESCPIYDSDSRSCHPSIS